MVKEYKFLLRKIKSRIVTEEAAFKKKRLFASKLYLNLRKKLVKCWIWSHSSLWYWKSDTSESWSETSGKFWNLMLQKDGEDQLVGSCERWRSITNSHGGKDYPAYNKRKAGRKANSIGHMLHRNCLLKHVIEGHIKEKVWQEDEEEDVNS
jgi:hypothetical protein